jgi:hypothetical protein
MKTKDNWEEKANLKGDIQGLRKMQIDYINLMLFLKCIRESLNAAWKKDGFTYDGLNKTANFIDSQIDGYNYGSFDVGDLSYNIDKIHERLTGDLNKLE